MSADCSHGFEYGCVRCHGKAAIDLPPDERDDCIVDHRRPAPDTEDGILASLYRLVELPFGARGDFEHLDGDRFCDRLCTFSFIKASAAKKAARDHNFAGAWNAVGICSELIARSHVPDIVHTKEADAIRARATFHLDVSIKVIEGLEKHVDRRIGR